ncbi:hypothetical protein K9M79_03505 [Candidatus Woesearchaeota archaeon]|nr:hypothetical protein [Candidatus Woesearchaeota archaeon]
MKDIIKVFEKRKQDLINTLRNYSSTLEPAKQHQLFGAINEIDVFLNTLYYYEEQRVAKPQQDGFANIDRNMDERIV